MNYSARGSMLGLAVVLIVAAIVVFLFSRDRDAPDGEAAEYRAKDGQMAQTSRSVSDPGEPEQGSVGRPLDPKLIEWNAIARKKNLQLVDSSLDVSAETIELLGLGPVEAIELNAAMRRFIGNMKADELSRAYVSVAEDGGEEIVIPAGDRKPFLKALRSEIAEKVGDSVAEFILEQIPFDNDLAVSGREMRVAIEKGDDGAERVAFTRHVRRQEAYDENIPVRMGKVNLGATNSVTTHSLLNDTVDPRIEHLFAAEAKLPRRPVPAAVKK